MPKNIHVALINSVVNNVSAFGKCMQKSVSILSEYRKEKHAWYLATVIVGSREPSSKSFI